MIATWTSMWSSVSNPMKMPFTRIGTFYLCLLLLLLERPCFGQSIRFDSTVIHCGKVEEGPEVRKEVVFTNIANVPVRITDVKSTGGGQVAEWTKEEIRPGQTGKIRILYNTKGKFGKFGKALYVRNSLDSNSEIILMIEGEVMEDSNTTI